MKRNVDMGLLILRITLGVLMLLHGISKIAGGFSGIKGLLATKHLPGFFVYGSMLGEVVAPLMILIGFRTRLAAPVYAFNMVVAILMTHAGDLLALNRGGGYALELQMLYMMGAVALFFTGAGKYAASSTSKWD